MSTPPNPDIGINPFKSDRRLFFGCVATVPGITYGMVVIVDLSTGNARDVKLPAGAGAIGLRGVVSDQGDPNNGGQFAVGDEFGACREGVVEVLLDGGQTATKGQPLITGATPGTVKPIGTEPAPYDVVGYVEETVINSGTTPRLISMYSSIQRRHA